MFIAANSDVLVFLLDDKVDIREKAARLGEFVRDFERHGKTWGIGYRMCRQAAVFALFNALPAADGQARGRLETVLDEINAHCSEQEAVHVLRGLDPDTPLGIMVEG